MPATSEKQRHVMAIAEHHPEALYRRNRGLLKMSHRQLHDFASTTKPEIKSTKAAAVRRRMKRGR